MEHNISSVLKTDENYIVQGISEINGEMYIWNLFFDKSFNSINELKLEPQNIYSKIKDFVYTNRLRTILLTENNEIQLNTEGQFIRKVSKDEIEFITDNIFPREIIIEIISEEPDEAILNQLILIPGTKLQARIEMDKSSVKGQKHVHVIKKGKELFSVNIDGTAHHRKNRGVEINKNIAEYLREFKGFNIREDNVLTMISIDTKLEYYYESIKFIKASEKYIAENVKPLTVK